MKAEASTIEQQLKKAYQEVERETGQSKAITSITAANVVAYPVQSNLQSLSARDLPNFRFSGRRWKQRNNLYLCGRK